MKINIYAMFKTLLFTMQNGKSLSNGLDLLANTEKSKKTKKIYKKINTDIKDGKSFSQSLARHKICSLDIIQFVSMAEKGVNFKQALEKIIRYLEVKEKFQRESSDQTSLPVIYFSLAALVVLGVKFIAIPMQIEKSKNYTAEILELISGHMYLVQVMTNTLFVLLIILASYFFILLTALFSQSRNIQFISKYLALKMPFSSKIILSFEKFMLFSMLGDMLESGISYKKAMSSALKTTTVGKFQKAIQTTLDTIKNEGKFIFHSSLYDDMEKALLTGVGSTQQVGKVMLEISDRARTEAMQKSLKLFRIVTFLSIFLMAFAVFIVFFAVVLTQVLIQKGLIDMSKGMN